MPTSLPRLTPARQSTVSTLGSLVSRARQAIQPPKAKTRREQQKEELFSHYVLNKDPEASKYDLGVPRCCGAFTPSTRVVSRNDGSGWFLFRF